MRLASGRDGGVFLGWERQAVRDVGRGIQGAAVYSAYVSVRSVFCWREGYGEVGRHFRADSSAGDSGLCVDDRAVCFVSRTSWPEDWRREGCVYNRGEIVQTAARGD